MPPRQVADIPFNGGLKQKTAPPWLDPTQQILAQSCIWVQDKILGKRPGVTSGAAGAQNISYPSTSGLSGEISFSWGATSLSSGIALMPSGGGAAISDGLYIYNNSTTQQYNEWIDYASPCVGTRKGVGASAFGVYNPTVTEHGAFTSNGVYATVRLYVWEDFAEYPGANTLVYSLVDSVTGARLAQGTINDETGIAPHVIQMGMQAVVFYGVGTSIKYATLNLSALPGSWSVGTVVTDWAGGVFDVGNTPGYTTGGSPGSFWANVIYGKQDGPDQQVACQLVSLLNGTSTLSVLSGNKFNLALTSGTVEAVGTRWDFGRNNLWVGWDILNTTSELFGLCLNMTFGGTLWGVTEAFTPQSFTGAVSAGELLFQTNQIGIEILPGSSPETAVFVWQALNEEVDDAVTQQDTVVSYAKITNAGAITGPQPFGFGLQMISRPFAVKTPDVTYGFRVYSYCADVKTQTSHFLVEWDVNAISAQSGGGTGQPGFGVPRPCATFAPRLTNLSPLGIYLRRNSGLSDVTNLSNTTIGVYTCASGISETNDTPAQQSAMGLTSDFTHPARSKSVELGGITYCAGGMPSSFDGVSCVESSNLTTCQEIYALATEATGGHLTNAQEYFYIWIPEWRDSAGNVHYGQPTTPVSVTTASGGTGTSAKVTGTVPYISIARKGDVFHSTVQHQSNLYLVPYRTAYIGSAMSTTYYRLVPDSPGPDYVNQPNSGQPSLNFADTVDDSVLAQNPEAPTTGGVIEADAPSSFQDICVHNSRVYGIGDDSRTIWVSTVQQDGVPCTFNDGSQFEVSFLGDLVAIWSQDSYLFIASTTGIAYCQGGGPNITGAQSDLSPPVPIPTDVGVLDCRAICVTPAGTVLRTIFGLALLDRSLSIHSDFGDPVTQYLQQYTTVTNIIQHPSRPEIWVQLSQGSLSGISLIYNYRYQAWSTTFITDPDYFASQGITNDALVIGGVFYLLDGHGRLFREKNTNDATQYYDTSNGTDTWLPMTVTSSWIKPGGTIGGEGWVHNFLTSFNLQDWTNISWTMALNYNQDSSYNTWVKTSAQMTQNSDVSGLLGQNTSVRLKPNPTRCTSFSITISDAPPGTAPFAITGQGAQIFALSCELEPLEGLRRLAAIQSG